MYSRLYSSAAKSIRPLSPHLQIYKWWLNMAMSTAHRLTGIALSGGVYGGAMIYAVAPFQSAAFVGAFHSLPGIAIFGAKTIASLPLTYHTLNGIRHLVWDAGYGLALKSVYSTGYAVTGASLLASIALAAK